MFRKLVVPLDGSDLGERALPYAVQLARAGQGRVLLVRVAVAPPSMNVDGMDWERDRQEAVADATQYLRTIAAQFGDEVPVETCVAYGRPAAQILEQVSRFEADAIVIATHGRTGLAHLLFGSTTETVLAESTVPVFLVHARSDKPVGRVFDPAAGRLLVPLDGSLFAEAALELAVDFVGPAGELVLMRVIEPPDHVLRDDQGRPLAYLDQQAQDRTRVARTYLDEVAHRLRQTHPELHLSVDIRMDQPPDEGILTAAFERATDLVIMATHGRTGLRRASMGSVAGKVLRKGSAPLLLVRPVMASAASSRTATLTAA